LKYVHESYKAIVGRAVDLIDQVNPSVGPVRSCSRQKRLLSEPQ